MKPTIVYTTEGTYSDRDRESELFYAGTDLDKAKDKEYAVESGYFSVAVQQWVNGDHVRTLEADKTESFEYWYTTYDKVIDLKNEINTLKFDLEQKEALLHAINYQEEEGGQPL